MKTSDGWISFTVNTNSQVRAFLTVTGRQDLLDDPRFNSVAARAENVAEWFELRGAPLTHKTTDELLELLRSADIAVQPCHTLETLPNDEHLKAVGLIQPELHPTEGKVYAIRSTVRFDESYPSPRTPSQPRGWETQAVLQEAGYDDAEIKQMITDGTALVSSTPGA